MPASARENQSHKIFEAREAIGDSIESGPLSITDRTDAFSASSALPIEEVASALDVSLATAKRRLSKAWNRVVVLAERDTALVDYLASIQKDGVDS